MPAMQNSWGSATSGAIPRTRLTASASSTGSAASIASRLRSAGKRHRPSGPTHTTTWS